MSRTLIYVIATVKSLATAQYPLDQFDQAIESAMSREGIKTMVVPGA